MNLQEKLMLVALIFAFITLVFAGYEYYTMYMNYHKLVDVVLEQCVCNSYYYQMNLTPIILP